MNKSREFLDKLNHSWLLTIDFASCN